MSKASKHIKWCIDKANNEIKNGERRKGLVKINSDKELAADYLKKAEHNLDAFVSNKKAKFYDWTISMGFYVMYHCFQAILARFSYESRNQTCTFAVIESLLEDKKIDDSFRKYLDEMKSSENKDDEILNMREKYQYTTIIDIDVQKVEELHRKCENMIKETRGIISN